jgi:hypothetical protein
MRILYYFPVSATKRFEPVIAIKGSAFFRRPNYDAMRLAFLSRGHEFFYYDERLEEKPAFEPDLLVVNTPLNLARYVETAVRDLWDERTKKVCFGIYPTLFPREAKRSFDSIVRGDIAAVWQKILEDMANKRLSGEYQSTVPRDFSVDRSAEKKYGMTPLISQLRTAFGCTCDERFADYCYERVLYPRPSCWEPEEVAREVATIDRKVIYLMDDDFMHDIDRGLEILDRCWIYKRMWIFQTKRRVFERPGIFSVLRDEGVRIIYLKEDWLGNDLTDRMTDEDFIKEKEHEVNSIHGNKMAVGAKLSLGYEKEDQQFYRLLLKFLIRLKLDMIEVSVRTPMPFTETFRQYDKSGRVISDLTLYDRWMPVIKIDQINQKDLYSWMEWLRDGFYSWDSIARRSIWITQKVGLYNTVFFHLIPNLSYRDNFLEKVGFPP